MIFRTRNWERLQSKRFGCVLSIPLTTNVRPLAKPKRQIKKGKKANELHNAYLRSEESYRVYHAQSPRGDERHQLPDDPRDSRRMRPGETRSGGAGSDTDRSQGKSFRHRSGSEGACPRYRRDDCL